MIFSQDPVQKLREMILTRVQSCEDDCIDEEDVTLIRKTDDLLWRFLRHDLESNDSVVDKDDLTQANLEESCQRLLNTLKWRSRYGINKFRDSDFPRELYQLKIFTYTYHEDIDRLFFYINVCKYTYISADVRNFFIKVLLYEIEKRIATFRSLYEHGLADLKPIVVIDCSGFKYHSLDVKFLISVLTIVGNHYPLIVDRIWIYGLPLFAKYSKPIIKRALPDSIAKRLDFPSQADMVKRLGSHLLPHFLGGTCPIQPSVPTPVDACNLDEAMKTLSLKSDDIHKLKKFVQSVLDE